MTTDNRALHVSTYYRYHHHYYFSISWLYHHTVSTVGYRSIRQAERNPRQANRGKSRDHDRRLGDV